MSRIMNSRWVGERRRSEEFREENSLGHVNCFTRPSKCANWTELLGDNTSKTILSKNSKKNIWQLSPCSELIRWINAIFLVFLRLTFGSRSCVPCLFSLSLFLVQRDRSRERNRRESGWTSQLESARRWFRWWRWRRNVCYCFSISQPHDFSADSLSRALFAFASWPPTPERVFFYSRAQLNDSSHRIALSFVDQSTVSQITEPVSFITFSSSLSGAYQTHI